MKIVLIQPPRTKGAIFVKLHKTVSEEAGIYPTLGLLYVATYISTRTKHKIKIIDCASEKYDYTRLREVILSEKPDIVGIYFCTEYLYDSLKTARLVKDIDRKIITVAGGPHLFIYPKETIAEPDIDYCVYGEGEVAFDELVNSIDKDEPPEKIPGIISKKNTNKRHELQRIQDINLLPFPDRRLLSFNKYKSFITYSNPITTIVTSRGCAFNCYYCNSIERGQKVRFLNPQKVVEEIEDIVKLGLRDILFFDENFFFNTKRIEGICDEIISRRIKIRWHCRSRADMNLEKSFLKKIGDAGCRMIQFGIESGTQRIQNYINKKLNIEEVKKTIRDVKDAGIMTYGNFMIGLPTETEDEMKHTLKFAVELNLDYASISTFNPLPDSMFYKMALNDGTIGSDYWYEYVKNPSRNVKYYWWPPHNKEVIDRLNFDGFKKFYYRPLYLLKAIFRKQSISQKIWQLKSAFKVIINAPSHK